MPIWIFVLAKGLIIYLSGFIMKLQGIAAGIVKSSNDPASSVTSGLSSFLIEK